MTGAAREVHIEVVLLAPTARGLSYRVVRAPLPARAAPDEHAIGLAGLVDGRPGAVCHSTSWRTEDELVVLTYAATPDPSPQQAAPLDEPSVICSQDPLRPRPLHVHAHHVAAHAARHLAFLADHDPTVQEALQQVPELLARLHALAATVPVAPHGLAHALARTR